MSVKKIRKHIGLTQLQLGEELGYGKGAGIRIHELEKKESISIRIEWAICRILADYLQEPVGDIEWYDYEALDSDYDGTVVGTDSLGIEWSVDAIATDLSRTPVQFDIGDNFEIQGIEI
jgi:DNA-binding XRE family transcriptional regulator